MYHSVCSLVGIGIPPPPSPASECASPPEPKGGWGGTHSPACDVVEESQFGRLKRKLSTLSSVYSVLHEVRKYFYHLSVKQQCGFGSRKKNNPSPPPSASRKREIFSCFQEVDILSSWLECLLKFGRLCGGLTRITKNIPIFSLFLLIIYIQ